MKERPIILNTEMVRATLEGRKTQTRRVIKPQPQLSGGQWLWRNCSWTKDKPHCPTNTLELPIDYCPYGQVGDRLWVRETWAVNKIWDAYKPSKIPSGESVYYPNGGDPEDEIAMPYWVGKRRPSIYLPRWASRITLEITGIRVERLQEITEEDANKEGNPYPDMGGKGSLPPLWWFKELWDSLNAKRGYSWESNPWVWVISFKRI